MANEVLAAERVETRLDGIESRLSRLEGLIEQMDRRLSNLEQTLRQIMGDQTTAFRWLVGLILVTWLSTIMTILLKG